jgi:small-conductance mechanosensitive channel
MDIKQLFDHSIFGIRLEGPIIFCLKVIAIVIIARIVLLIVNRLFNKASRRPHTVLDVTSRKYFQRIIKAIIYIIAISSILILIPGMEKIGSSILTSAGIMAAAIGLASQEALSNFIGGLFIIISKPFRVGDLVQIDNNVVGTVKEITLRHTVIVNFENRTIFVPNCKINSTTIINSTALETDTCAFVEMGVAHTENLDRVIEVMREEVMKHPSLIDHRTAAEQEAGEPIVKIKVLSIGDVSVNLRAWAWAATTGDAFNMKCDLLKSIKERFDAEGIEIPYPYYNIIMSGTQKPSTH